MKKSLIWFCHSPSPYNSDLFDEIEQSDSFDLHVYYTQQRVSTHPWQANLTSGHKHSIFESRFFGVDWRTIINVVASLFGKQRSVFIVAGWTNPTLLLLILIFIVSRSKYLIWSDTPNLYKPRPPIKKILRSVFLDYILAHAHRVMGTGLPAVDAFLKMGVPISKVRNFPVWINEEKYKSDFQNKILKNIESKKLIFLSIGIVEFDRKGHDLALRALSHASKKGAFSFEYRIAGAGKDEDKLIALAEELNALHCVRILGWLELPELIVELNNCDIVIHPSPVHEPYGVAVLEAMASGSCVIASDLTCAALDRIKNGENGFIYKSESLLDLEDKIMNIAQNPKIIFDCSINASITSQQWRIKRSVIELKSIIEEN